MRKSDWLQRHLELCIGQAEKCESLITPEDASYNYLNGESVRHLLNCLCQHPDVKYLEVGLNVGSTFCSALRGNSVTAIGMDDWSYHGREEFMPRLEAARGFNKVEIIEGDCFTKDIGWEQPNVFFYDGDHSYESQRKALTHFTPQLNQFFVYLCDDWEHPTDLQGVQLGTAQGIKDAKLRTHFQTVLRGPGWHFGLAAYLFERMS